MKHFQSKTQLILYFMRGTKRYFAASAIFALLVSLLDLIGPKIISFAVDSVIGNKTPQLTKGAPALAGLAGGMEGLRAHPGILAGAAGAVGIGAALSRYLFRTLTAKGGERFVQRARDELFEHILYLPYTWLGENSTGDIIQRCTSDVQMIKRFLSEQLVMLVRTIILMALAIWFMWGISVPVTLVCAAFIPIMVAYSLFFHSRIASAFEKADIEEGKLSTIAQENLTGVRVVRAFGREEYERERFVTQNKGYTAYWIYLHRLLAVFWCSGDLIMGMQMLCVTLLGSVMCVKYGLTAGALIALISYTVMLSWPVRLLGRVISELSKAGISIDRLRYIMNSPVEELPGGGERRPLPMVISCSTM